MCVVLHFHGWFGGLVLFHGGSLVDLVFFLFLACVRPVFFFFLIEQSCLVDSLIDCVSKTINIVYNF